MAVISGNIFKQDEVFAGEKTLVVFLPFFAHLLDLSLAISSRQSTGSL